ncbi:bactericidal permeability-increasing protein-like [Brachyhypopomus gauderio]|uniref:bactericidal permeability-increasing protein-like n=1 Tax=Brachyhypopomus gauderio TaxID=698409 RepID=UPI0040427BF7
MMTRWCILVLLALSCPESSGTDAGVKVKITQKGLEYGRQIGIATLLDNLKTINVPDISGKQDVFPIGDVSYSLTGIEIVDVGLPQSEVGLVPGTGVSLTISNAYINLRGNWRVKYLGFISDSGSFDLAVSGLTISVTISVQSDETGRPMVSSANCAASVGRASITFHGGASWLYNLFSSFINDALRDAIQSQICPLVSDAINKMNPHLKTLNVLAKVDQYAEIEYSMVESPVISASSIDLGLKGEFYNIGAHQEPPFSPVPFSLPLEDTNMLYMGVSTFTANSAGFVYNTAGVLSITITDDMIPSSSPFRLDTKTFGNFIPQIAKQFPGLKMDLLVKTATAPTVTFAPNNMTLQASATITAYAIQPNTTLTPLFILNVDAGVSGQIYVTGVKVAGNLTLNTMNVTLGTSFVGPFEVKSIASIFQLVLKAVVIPKVNDLLNQGFPLPAIGDMNLVNTQLVIMKDYVLIGTDVQFTI